MATLIIIRQRGGPVTIHDSPHVIRDRYITEAAKIVQKGEPVPLGNHIVAVFRYGDIGDLIEAHSILGGM